MNGGLNLSELDGWWAEAYRPEVGLVLGDDQEHGDDPARDTLDAERLDDVLEREVIPGLSVRDEQGNKRETDETPNRSSVVRVVSPAGGRARCARRAYAYP